MSQEQRASRIPDFKTREEEAEFWDTHDFTDFWDETRPVEITVSQALRDRVEARARDRNDPADLMTVRLERADREELTRRADEQGVGPATLVRMWVEERLRGERAAG